MSVQGREKIQLYNVIYVPQAVKNILSVSMIISKGAIREGIKDKMTIKKNGVSMDQNARKG